MEASTPSGAAAGRKKKPNSPKAPGTSLRSAVAEVTKVYQRYSHGTFSRGEMANALGMSSGSGAFLSKASTLKEYGLIIEGGGAAQVSDLFKAIYQAPAGSAELKRNAFQAIRTPSAFDRLLEQFKTRVPDEEALALRLETQDRFNRDRARQVAGAFRSSLNEYGLIDGTGNLMPVREDEAGHPASQAEEAEADAEAAVGIAASPDMQRLEVALREGRKAVLVVPADLTMLDTKKIGALLSALAADYDTE